MLVLRCEIIEILFTNKQININEFHHLQAQDLIVPSFPGCAAWMAPWTCDFLKQHFLNLETIKLPSLRKRIYITRKLAKPMLRPNNGRLTKTLL